MPADLGSVMDILYVFACFTQSQFLCFVVLFICCIFSCSLWIYLSVAYQWVIAWKRSSLKWPIMCRAAGVCRPRPTTRSFTSSSRCAVTVPWLKIVRVAESSDFHCIRHVTWLYKSGLGAVFCSTCTNRCRICAVLEGKTEGIEGTHCQCQVQSRDLVAARKGAREAWSPHFRRSVPRAGKWLRKN